MCNRLHVFNKVLPKRHISLMIIIIFKYINVRFYIFQLCLIKVIAACLLRVQNPIFECRSVEVITFKFAAEFSVTHIYIHIYIKVYIFRCADESFH